MREDGDSDFLEESLNTSLNERKRTRSFIDIDLVSPTSKRSTRLKHCSTPIRSNTCNHIGNVRSSINSVHDVI